MRVATWNLNNRGRSALPNLAEFARSARVDLLLLQEANPTILIDFAAEAGLDWVVNAIDAGAPVSSETGRRRLAAIAGRGRSPECIGLLPDVPLPERAVHARVKTGLGDLTVASYHAPPGVNWGYTKVEHAHALLRWVKEGHGPLVVGVDANTPEVDHPDRGLVRTHWHTGSKKLSGRVGDDVTFGGRPQHRLRDAYRLWLDARPLELSRVREERPDGPLAVSHYTGRRRGHAGTPRRFDALWISPELTPTFVGYDYDGAVAAGTDHALVVADLNLAEDEGGAQGGRRVEQPPQE